MRAFVLPGPNQTPELVQQPGPRPAAGQVLVRVAACGLNFADLLTIKGTYQERPDMPAILGMEVSGIVQETGPGVDPSLVGKRVAGFPGIGGLADQVCLPADRCTPMPDAMSFEDAAAFQIAYGTSHVALDHLARLKPGETLLVLGAAGGVGLTAVEIGKLMGATVIACARGQDKLQVAARAGADHLIDSDAGDLRDRVKALGGADVVYDPVGGDLFAQAMRATKRGGRLIPIGFASGTVPQIPANHLLVKNLTVFGFYWGGYLKLDPGVITGSMAQLFDWYAQGRLKPEISHRFPLEKTAEALDVLRARRSTGKVMVLIDQHGALPV